MVVVVVVVVGCCSGCCGQDGCCGLLDCLEGCWMCIRENYMALCLAQESSRDTDSTALDRSQELFRGSLAEEV